MSAADRSRSLFERFPSLLKLESMGSRKRIPYVQQTSAVDCGAACLSMVLGYFGRDVPLQEVRRVAGVSRDGSNALNILNAGRLYGLRGRGVKCEMQGLEYLQAPAILHWEFNHFVVFERLVRKGVEIVDPALGRRVIDLEQFGKSFTGVALLLEPSESFTTAKDESDLLWRYLKRILSHREVLARVLVTSVLVQLFALALPLLTASLVDRVIPRNDYRLLGVLLAGFLGMTLFKLLTTIVRSYLLLHLRTNLDTKLTFDFMDHLMDLPFEFFQSRSAGDLIMRLASNATIREILTSGALSGLLDGILVSFYLVILFVVHPYLGGLVFLLGLLRVAVFLLARRRHRELMTEGLQTRANLQSHEVQMLQGIETLKASGVEHRSVEHWANLFVNSMNVSLSRSRLTIKVEAGMGVLDMASPLVILGYGGYLVMTGGMSLGTMLAMSALAAGFLGPLSNLVATALQLNDLGSYFDRIRDVMEADVEQQREQVTVVDKLEGRITLENVSFRYGPLSPLVTRDVSLEIEPGKSVAIVGPSGSGKSSLARLLVGLYPPTAGRVLFDGVDLKELDHRSVRRKIGYVPQDPFMFGLSIRENIALSDPDIPLETLVEAAKTAEIHDDIVAAPMGYDTLISESGGSLSAGQRQRLAIARALIHRPSILLLDEATSALDAVTEKRVMHNLERMRCTRIAIAHRLSTIIDADLILVLEDGRIVEHGRHEELMAHGARYADLVAAQISRHSS